CCLLLSFVSPTTLFRSKSELPKLWPLLVSKGYLLLPLIVIFVLLSVGLTPMTAAFYAVLATVGLNVLVQVLFLVFKGVDGWKNIDRKSTRLNSSHVKIS